jgi:hypothetical protein
LIDEREALLRAEVELGRIAPDRGGGRLAIVDVTEHGFGWVVHYDTARFAESGDAADSVGPTAPLIVDRRDGSIHPTGMEHPLEHYLDEYERVRP